MAKVDLGKIIYGVASGDTLSSVSMVAVGYATSYAKDLDILIPMCVDPSITSFTCTGLVLALRSADGGFVATNGYNVISQLGANAITKKEIRANGLYLRVNRSTAWDNITNNSTFCGFVNFSGSFSST